MIDFEDATPIATPALYRAALLALRDSEMGISTHELEMLTAHWNSPEHTITTSQMAEKMGFKNYSVANLQYGRLAHRIADELHYWPGSEDENAPHWWRTIAYGKEASPEEEIQHYQWVMRPELVSILRQMRWV